MLSFFIHWFVFLFLLFFMKSLLFLPISHLPSCYHIILSFINSFITYSIDFVNSFLKSNLFHSSFIHFLFFSLIPFISFIVYAFFYSLLKSHFFIHCFIHFRSFLKLLFSFYFLTFFLYSICFLSFTTVNIVFPVSLSFQVFHFTYSFVSIFVPQLPFWSLSSSGSPIFLFVSHSPCYSLFLFSMRVFLRFPPLIVFYTSSRFFLLCFLQCCCCWWYCQRCKHQRLLFLLFCLNSLSLSQFYILHTLVDSFHQFIFSLPNHVVSFVPSFTQIFALCSFGYRFFFFYLPILSPFSF